MNITIRQFQIFEAVAQHLSYTRAAEVLYLSQPAVSMQIKQLETEVEMPLFERMGKKLFLTEAGEELLIYARNISQQLVELDEVMDEIRGSERGSVTIAVATTANYFALKLLGEFYRRFSGTNISLDVTNRESLLKHLNENTVDMVIMGQPPEGMNVESTPFMDNPLVVIAPKGHELTKRKQIPLSVLQQETFIMREHGSGTRIAMERFFEDSGYSISSVMEMSSNEAINQAVEAGLGLGIVSHHTLELELALDRLEVLDVESFPIMRHWYLVHREGKRLTALMDEFKRLVINEAGEILER
ncbi:MAG: LysR family transcriptional regulator [Gammaproteobacteria bacterium]|nr:MAG: LysR family transcriptional regulator [Gammaproteobacteria bacterium]RLA02221.1 MAG: LysR family transcriptional regulator [Gammaproteobacteria bacterium]